MASTTTNIGLTKPAGTDQALISAINGNMDIIDTKMGAVGNTSVQGQITALSDQIANVSESTTITNLSDVPVNSQGRLSFSAGVSPTGSAGTFNYSCIGSSARRSMTAYDTITNKFYNNALGGSGWVGWTCLADQIASDSGLQYIKVDGNDSYIMYRKIGKIVMMYAHHKVSSATIAAWSNYFFTQDMPQNFRPAIDIVVPMVHDRSGGEGCAFAVNANGNVYISGRNTGATATGEILQATVTYIVA